VRHTGGSHDDESGVRRGFAHRGRECPRRSNVSACCREGVRHMYHASARLRGASRAGQLEEELCDRNAANACRRGRGSRRLHILSRPAAPQATSRAPSATVEPHDRPTAVPPYARDGRRPPAAPAASRRRAERRDRGPPSWGPRGLSRVRLWQPGRRLPGPLGTTRFDVLHACIPSHVERDPGRERQSAALGGVTVVNTCSCTVS